MMLATHPFVFNLDPVLFHIAGRGIRYYGLIFALTLLVGYTLWRRQMRRGGYSLEVADGLLIWCVVAIVLGARLGHVLFYDPAIILQEPLRILAFWEGGLSSHGAAVGLLVTLVLYARRHKRPVLEFMDRFAFSAAVGATGIRLGNFFNSEIVGRATHLPWAVIFVQYDQANGLPPTPRHPSQLYEFCIGLLVLALLVWVDKRAGREKRPMGLMTATFLIAYFIGRFCVEFVKEPQGVDNHWPLTMGQFLSLPGLLAGVCLLIWVARHPHPAPALPAPCPAAAESSDKSNSRRRHRRRKH
jgi:phosphatidylglycerol---prolipoprotein diacylglyceryl transferase